MSGPADRSGPPDDPDWGDFDVWADDGSDEARPGGPGSAPFRGLEDDPRVQAGIEHVQRAAHEMIAASRALLDVAEELVDSPGGVTRLFGMLGELGEVAGRLARPGGRSDPDDGPDPEPPVQRIPVS